MSARGQLGGETLRHFILAGDARLTLENVSSGARYTYRVRRAPAREGEPETANRPWFVSVLTGPENTNHYTYIGCLWDADRNGEMVYSHGKKSRISADAPSARGAAWLVRHAFYARPWPAVMQVWHEGRCGCCGRTLTVPESITSGIGPKCAERMGL